MPLFWQPIFPVIKIKAKEEKVAPSILLCKSMNRPQIYFLDLSKHHKNNQEKSLNLNHTSKAYCDSTESERREVQIIPMLDEPRIPR